MKSCLELLSETELFFLVLHAPEWLKETTFFFFSFFTLEQFGSLYLSFSLSLPTSK